MFNVPPSGGSLEIGNVNPVVVVADHHKVPPSGGSLEIGNLHISTWTPGLKGLFPLRGDP